MLELVCNRRLLVLSFIRFFFLCSAGMNIPSMSWHVWRGHLARHSWTRIRWGRNLFICVASLRQKTEIQAELQHLYLSLFITHLQKEKERGGEGNRIQEKKVCVIPPLLKSSTTERKEPTTYTWFFTKNSRKRNSSITRPSFCYALRYINDLWSPQIYKNTKTESKIEQFHIPRQQDQSD